MKENNDIFNFELWFLIFCDLDLLQGCMSGLTTTLSFGLNPLDAELNPICYLLALLAHHFLHVSRIRVKSLTLWLLMSYIYGAPILDVSRSHTTTQHSRWDSCRSPAEIVGSNPTGRHGYFSVVSVVCCQVEVSATS